MPKHVFISYSRKDAHYADRVVHHLERAGFKVWIDRSELAPGTADFEREIRDAIKTACAYVLIATPNSAQSSVVFGEFKLAQSKKLPIYPFWAAGEIWEEAVRLDLISRQYIDGRPDNFEQAIEVLIESLKIVVDAGGESTDSGAAEFHPSEDLVSIKVDGSEVVSFKLSEYRSFGRLVDVLYQSFTYSIVGPQTYGRDWVLAQQTVISSYEDTYPLLRLALDWNTFAYLSTGKTALTRIERSDSLEANSMTANSIWEVIYPPRLNYIGVAGMSIDMFCPGMNPVNWMGISASSIDAAIQSMLEAGAEYFPSVAAKHRMQIRRLTPRSLKISKHIYGRDLFVVYDRFDQFPDFHLNVIAFQK